MANLNVHKLNSPTRHGHVTASPSSQSCHQHNLGCFRQQHRLSQKIPVFLTKPLSFLFGGFGYGPDSTHTEDHYGTIFDSNYESQGVKYFQM